jgi:hypothetical protein
MDLPDLISGYLGDETIESAVRLGDEDLICFTPTRVLLYRGEGLIGDESIEVYQTDVERLDVSGGRRKTAFTLEHVDGEEQFSVSQDRSDAVLQGLFGSVLAAAGVLEDGESVRDVYLFSELTVVVTDARLVKHVGAYVWDADFEEFPFNEVTGLDFEEGSVATGIVLSVAGRPQRFKAPSDEATLLRRSLTNALCEFYDVTSPAQLDSLLAGKADRIEDDSSDSSGEIEFDDSISPLVSDSGDEPDATLETGTVEELGESTADTGLGASTAESAGEAGEAESTAGDPGQSTSGPSETTEPGRSAGEAGKTPDSGRSTGEPAESDRSTGAGGEARQAIDPDQIDAMQTRLSKLTTAVKRQNELLREQRETMQTLVEELREREREQ